MPGCIITGFATLYGILATALLVCCERKHDRRRALHVTVDVINFINAVTATTLSSAALWSMSAEQRRDVAEGIPNALAVWTVESVCGYIIVETVLFVVSHCRGLSVEDYQHMSYFHIVAFTGLLSVLVSNSGYAVALWTIWSELTSIFLGIECFLEQSSQGWVCRVTELCGDLAFVSQRVLVFFYLLYLCLTQFRLELMFVVQTSILVTGTIMNGMLAIDRLNASSWWYRTKQQ